jgi:hypothetical protein
VPDNLFHKEEKEGDRGKRRREREKMKDNF